MSQPSWFMGRIMMAKQIVWRADDYLDLRAQHQTAFQRAERAGLVRVTREQGDLEELIVLVDRRVAEARR